MPCIHAAAKLTSHRDSCARCSQQQCQSDRLLSSAALFACFRLFWRRTVWRKGDTWLAIARLARLLAVARLAAGARLPVAVARLARLLAVTIARQIALVDESAVDRHELVRADDERWRWPASRLLIGHATIPVSRGRVLVELDDDLGIPWGVGVVPHHLNDHALVARGELVIGALLRAV